MTELITCMQIDYLRKTLQIVFKSLYLILLDGFWTMIYNIIYYHILSMLSYEPGGMIAKIHHWNKKRWNSNAKKYYFDSDCVWIVGIRWHEDKHKKFKASKFLNRERVKRLTSSFFVRHSIQNKIKLNYANQIKGNYF